MVEGLAVAAWSCIRYHHPMTEGLAAVTWSWMHVLPVVECWKRVLPLAFVHCNMHHSLAMAHLQSCRHHRYSVVEGLASAVSHTYCVHGHPLKEGVIIAPVACMCCQPAWGGLVEVPWTWMWAQDQDQS
jgi:hypothetical protein